MTCHVISSWRLCRLRGVRARVRGSLRLARRGRDWSDRVASERPGPSESPPRPGLFCCTKECGAGLADTVWEFTIHTRFGTSPHSELQGLVGGRNILQGHRPALGAGGRLHVKFHPLRRTAVGWPGPLAAGGPGCPRAVGATRAFKFESGRQTRRVLRSTVTIRGPPARPSCPSVPGRPSDSLSAPGRRSARPCAPARALVLSEWEAGVASKKETPSNRHRLDHHHTHTFWE